MIRVIVESPFAPRTQIPAENTCPLQAKVGIPCTHMSTPMDEGFCYNLCAYHKVFEVRAEESALHARYLAAALRDCVLRGETPYASHGLLTLPGVLRDEVPAERERGIAAGFAWREVAHGSVFYVDLGWSSGMKAGERHASELHNRHIVETRPKFHWLEERTLGPDWDRK